MIYNSFSFKMRYLICLFLLFCGGSYGQQIRLRVLDESTREPIVAAVVSYTEPTYSDKLQHSVADDKGVALLKKHKDGTLYYQIQSLGYKAKKGILSEQKDVTIYLSQETTALTATTITASNHSPTSH